MAFRIGQPDVATPQELSKHVCIVDTNRVDFTRWRFYKDGAECIYHPSRHLLVNSARVARDWALNGRGIALCPSFVLQKGHRRWPTDSATWGLYDENPSALCRVFTGSCDAEKSKGIDFAVEDFRNSM